jgi:hypothetical protein
MAAESVHGTLRRLFLETGLGDLRARQVSVFTGMLLIFVIAILTVRWMRLETIGQLFLVGALWVALTAVFEFVLGLAVLDYGMERMTQDLDPSRGGLMAFGLLFMLFAPLVAARIRRTGPFRLAA